MEKEEGSVNQKLQGVKDDDKKEKNLMKTAQKRLKPFYEKLFLIFYQAFLNYKRLKFKLRFFKNVEKP